MVVRRRRISPRGRTDVWRRNVIVWTRRTIGAMSICRALNVVALRDGYATARLKTGCVRLHWLRGGPRSWGRDRDSGPVAGIVTPLRFLCRKG